MWRLVLCCLLLPLFAGCLRPLTVTGTVDADLDADVNGAVQVTADIPPVRPSGPMVAMPLAPGAPRQFPKVAVVDVDGLLLDSDMTGLYSLGENPVALFRERLDAVANDSCVCALVLRINSPGGSVTATDIMWHDLRSFKRRTKLPVVACLMDLGAGGAYYLATAADQIVAHPTSVTGGIGVILNVYNLQDAMAQFNVVGAPIKAGKNIDVGTPIVALDQERRAMLQAMADEFHARFRQVVIKSRAEVDASLETNFDGRVFTAKQALARHLIDTIGYLDDAVAAGRGMSGEPQAVTTFFHRANDPARSPYAVTPNVPLQSTLIPLSLPGLDRSRLPSFLYLWQPEPTLEKLGGR
jgi:protease-4